MCENDRNYKGLEIEIETAAKAEAEAEAELDSGDSPAKAPSKRIKFW